MASIGIYIVVHLFNVPFAICVIYVALVGHFDSLMIIESRA